MADEAERKMIHAWRDRAIRAEAERDALLRVARALVQLNAALDAHWNAMPEERAKMITRVTNVQHVCGKLLAALPAALLAKVKGGEG